MLVTMMMKMTLGPLFFSLLPFLTPATENVSILPREGWISFCPGMPMITGLLLM